MLEIKIIKYKENNHNHQDNHPNNLNSNPNQPNNLIK